MAVETIIVNFGAPRSGTTWMRECLRRVKGPFVSKLMEYSALHPCKSPDGLITLADWFHKERFVLVRTVRHPLEIAESFAAAKTPELRRRVGGLADNTDQDVLDWIRSESENTAAQRGAPRRHDTKDTVPLVEVRYESLANPLGRSVFVDRLKPWLGPRDRDLLASALASFGRRPARSGRLSAGIGSVLSAEKREWYKEKLADVIAREGYK